MPATMLAEISTRALRAGSGRCSDTEIGSRLRAWRRRVSRRRAAADTR